MVKNPTASAGDIRDTGSITESGRCPGEGHRQLTPIFFLENTMDRGAWRVMVYMVPKSWT